MRSTPIQGAREHIVREAVMPIRGGRKNDMPDIARSVVLFAAGLAVIAAYVGLPLMVVTADIFHVLPIAAAASAGIFAVVVIGVGAVLTRTTSMVQAEPLATQSLPSLSISHGAESSRAGGQ
jgi:uncharacterized membrane protein